MKFEVKEVMKNYLFKLVLNSVGTFFGQNYLIMIFYLFLLEYEFILVI